MKLYLRTISADQDTPLSIFSRMTCESDCFLLESAERGEIWSRYSILGFEPACVAVQRRDGLRLRARGGSFRDEDGDIFEWLRRQVLTSEKLTCDIELPFTGGAVGYFAYDAIPLFEPGVSMRPDADVLAAWMLVDRFIVMDSLRGVLHICVVAGRKEEAERQLDRLESAVMRNGRLPLFRLGEIHGTQTPKPEMEERDYRAIVEKAKEYILAGDIFQVVLSQRFSAPLRTHPLHIYRAVRHINPSPYLFYLHIDDCVLVGSSPEILVRKQGRRAIVRPIAGTRPRGRDEHEDARLRRELLADAKERAEHIMLVDLGRNDLGRVCEFGSVHVSEQMVVEHYSHVMHIVSQVEGTMREDADALDLIAATFPAGTLSGAPKVRAMQIIGELEASARGAYGGCIGHVSHGGERMDTAIIIRTAVIDGRWVRVQAGAGIVADSDPAREHAECINKATAMFRAIALAESQGEQA